MTVYLVRVKTADQAVRPMVRRSRPDMFVFPGPIGVGKSCLGRRVARTTVDAASALGSRDSQEKVNRCPARNSGTPIQKANVTGPGGNGRHI